MEFKHIEHSDTRGLVKNLFWLTFSKEDLPFETIILPLGFPSIAYIFSNKQEILFKNKKAAIKELVITGQFYGTYDFFVNDVSTNIGLLLHPTSLYKILNTNISTLTNKITLLSEINKDLAEKFEHIFKSYKDDLPNYEEKIIKLVESLPIKNDQSVSNIDKAVNFIIEKNGLLQVNDLLDIVPYSQKSLETKFKKIVGLTPRKFIRQYRFMNLMQKYQLHEIDLNDLIYNYNYYDKSHFIRDFKLFIPQSPKKFFKEDYPLLKEYIRE